MFGHKLARAWGIFTLAALALITVFSLLPTAALTVGATGTNARLRAVHAVPDLGAVDIYVDGARTLSNVSFFTVSDYLTLPAGSYKVQVIPAGENINNPSLFAINASYTLVADRDYSLVARGRVANHSLGGSQIHDENNVPALGKVRVRAAHFSPNAPTVDIFVNGERVIENLAFRRTSSYLEVPAGTYTLGVAPAGGSPIYSVEVSLEANTVYTAWANGLLGATGATAFKLTPSVDAAFETARVRAVHAIPDIAGSPVDVYVNGGKIVTFDFFTATDYLTLTEGTYDVRVVLAGGNPATEAVIQANVTVEGGKDYSIIARGTGGTFGASVLEDDNSRPIAGQARVRVAHFSPDAPAVDIFLNGARSPVQGLSYLSATGYLDVPPGSYEVGVAPAGGSPIYSTTLTIEAGKVYTAWANGLLGGAGAKAFKVTPTVDADFPLARVRAVHAVPDIAGSPVDVYVNGGKIVTFDFFTATPYLPLYAGAYDVRVVLAGGNPATEAVIQANVTVEGGKDYSIIARGTGGTFGASVLEDDNSRPIAGQARVRVAHFSPDAPAVDIFLNGARSPVQGLSYLSATGYLDVPPGSYEVGVAPAGGSPIYSTTLTIEAGKVYTAWANGLLGGAGAQAFKVTPTVDAIYPTALVRLLHAVPDAPAVDIYLDGQLTAAGVRFGDLSGYLSVYPGSYAVAIKPAGSDVTAISGTLSVEGGKVYTAAAVGRLSGTPAASVALFEDSQARPAAGRSNLRVVHLSPDAPAVDVLSGGETLIDALAFGNAQSTELAAGLRTLQVALDAGGAVVLSGPVSLPSGEGATLFVVGLAGEAPAEQRLRLITASSLVGGAPAATFRVHLPLVR